MSSLSGGRRACTLCRALLPLGVTSPPCMLLDVLTILALALMLVFLPSSALLAGQSEARYAFGLP